MLLYIAAMTRCLYLLLLLPLSLTACDISGLILPPAGQVSASGPGGNRTDPHRALVDALGSVAGARELALLKPLLTRRLGSTLDDVVVGPNAQRFGRHMHTLQQGIQGGYTFPEPAKREDGRRDLPLRFKDGGNAQLIIQDEHGQPRIDRF